MLIATAGHVDHGKTTLVRRLTGVDTDRLPEEKKRGLTIDIGFAYGTTPGGAMLGFVDVPGHEKFVKNMLAGVPAVDHALLVIAADDGVMPQTREHLAILDLLGIASGTVAISKADRVDEARLAEVEAEVTALLADTALAGAPLYRTSGETGAGIQELYDHLHDLADRHAARGTQGRFRLAVDRAFTVTGAGLVVTGAVFSGRVRTGDRLLVSPSGIEVRVRGLRALDREAEEGRAGERCALNIAGAGLERAAIRRGDWLLDPTAHAPTRRIDARLKLLAGEKQPLKHWTPVHIHLGAADISGRVAILDGDAIAPGEDALVQLRLDAPALAVHGDRFILRDQSASRTLAGGMVIDPQGPARGRARPERLDALQALEEEDAATALAALLPLSPGGVDLDAFARARNLRAEEAQAVFDAQDMVTLPDAAGPLGLAHNHWQPLRQALLDAVGLWHRDKADELGPNEAAIRTRLPGPPAVGVLRGVVLELLGEGRLARTGMVLHLPDHKPQPSEQDETLWQKMLPLFDDASLRPPRVRELAEEFEMDVAATEAFLRRMVRFGRLLPVAANRFFPPQTVRALADIANALADEADDGTFDARAYKDRSGIGRNVTIEVLEYFDQAGFTRRAGNERTILRPAQEVFGAPATDGA